MRLPDVNWAGQGARDPPLRAGPALPPPFPTSPPAVTALGQGSVEWGPGREGAAPPQPCLLLPTLPRRTVARFQGDGCCPTERDREALLLLCWPKRDPRALGRHPARGKMSLSVLPSPPLGVVLNSAPQVQVCLSAGSACIFLFLPREPAYNLIARKPRPVCAGAGPLPVTGRLAG